jgi:hypothetical protein
MKYGALPLFLLGANRTPHVPGVGGGNIEVRFAVCELRHKDCTRLCLQLKPKGRPITNSKKPLPVKA